MINRPTLDKRIEQLDAAIAGTSTEELPKWIPRLNQAKTNFAKEWKSLPKF